MPQLKFEQLARHLQGSLAPIYIISGEEHLLVQEAGDLIRASAKQQGYHNREIYHVENNFDWGTLHHTSHSLGLFAEKKLIELRVNSKLNDKGRKALVEYAEQPPTDTLLLITLPKLERSQLSSKWFKTLEKAGQFIQIWPVNANQLPRWIEQRARMLQLNLNRDAVAMLASRVEGNLLAAAQELEKLRLMGINEPIDAKLLANAVADSARYNVFALVDNALQGDAINASKMLQGLRSEGAEVIGLLWALAREIRLLRNVQHQLNSGKNFAAVCKSLGVWQSRQSLIQTAVRRLNKNQLAVLLRLAAQCDRAIKGLHPADPWQVCLDIVLILAGNNPFQKETIRTIVSA